MSSFQVDEILNASCSSNLIKSSDGVFFIHSQSPRPHIFVKLPLIFHSFKVNQSIAIVTLCTRGELSKARESIFFLLSL